MNRRYRTLALPDGGGAKVDTLDDVSAVRGVALVHLETLSRLNGKRRGDESEVGVLWEGSALKRRRGSLWDTMERKLEMGKPPRTRDSSSWSSIEGKVVRKSCYRAIALG